MDPNATLSRFLDALGTGDRADAAEAISALHDWIAKGGFLPDDPRDRTVISPRKALEVFFGRPIPDSG